LFAFFFHFAQMMQPMGARREAVMDRSVDSLFDGVAAGHGGREAMDSEVGSKCTPSRWRTRPAPERASRQTQELVTAAMKGFFYMSDSLLDTMEVIVKSMDKVCVREPGWPCCAVT
jgi:hypothetical protein